MRKEYVRKPRKCPSCKSEKVAVILHGMPDMSDKLHRDLEEGRVILGGCCMEVDGPYWQCTDCDLPMYKKPPEPKLY